jgi:isoleucyl-tRNA synthetase
LPSGAPRLLDDLVADELNVDEVVVTDELAEVLSFDLVPNFKVLGPRLGSAVQHLRPALAALDGAAAAFTLEGGGEITVHLPDGPVALGPDDLKLRVRGRSGYAASRQGGEVVALDLAIDEGLHRRGQAREVVRQVQELRKGKGLAVSDRIRLWLDGCADLADQWVTVGSEVLAVSVDPGPGPGAGTPLELDGVDGAQAWVEVVG